MGRLGAHWAILSEASDRGRRHADAETGSHAALSTSLAASTALLAALKSRSHPAPAARSPPTRCPADDPRQPPSLAIVDVTNPQTLSHRPSLGAQRAGNAQPGECKARAGASC